MLDYRFLDQIKKLPYVEAVYLFGSRARGDSDDKSDIDLAIVCPKADVGEWLKLVDVVEKADTLLKIDCLRLDQLQDDRLKAEIERDKVILYERK